MNKDPKRQSFLARFSIYMGVGLAQQVVGLALLPVFSLVMGAAEIGVLAILMALEVLLIIVFDLAITASSVRHYHDHRGDKSAPTIARLFLVSLLVSLLIAPMAFVLIHWTWTLWTTVPEPSWNILTVLIASAFLQRINLFAQQMYRTREQARAFAAVAITRTIALLVLSLVLVGGMGWGILGVFLARGAAALLTCIPELKSLAWPALKPKDDATFDPLLPIWLFAAPLLLQQIANWARAFLDRIVLSNLIDAAALGVYFAASLSGMAFALLSVTFDQTFAPWYYRRRGAEGQSFRDYSSQIGRLYLTGLSVVAILSMAVAPEVYTIIFSGDLKGAGLIAPFIILGSYVGSTANFFSKSLVFNRRVSALPFYTVIGMALGFGMMFLVAPRIGAVAGSIALIIANLVLLFGAWFSVWRIERPDFSLAFALSSGSILAGYALFVHFSASPLQLHSIALRLAAAALCVSVILPLCGRPALSIALGALRRFRR